MQLARTPRDLPYNVAKGDGPLVDALEDKLQLIASGQAVAIASAGLCGDSLRPDLTTVSLEGLEPSHGVLATWRGARSSLVAAFRAAGPVSSWILGQPIPLASLNIASVSDRRAARPAGDGRSISRILFMPRTGRPSNAAAACSI